jgi:hypothetical protein
VAVILLWCVFLVLVWVIVFVGSQRLLFGEIILPQRPQHNRLVWGLFNYLENNCPENARNQAESYLLRIVVLTDATEVGDGYLLNVGTNTFHVRDRYVRRIRGVKDRQIPSRANVLFRTEPMVAERGTNCYRVTDAQE